MDDLNNSQKLSNDLNLSLGIPVSELMKSTDLSTGYSPEGRLWELIIKYNGDIVAAVAALGGFATPLIGGYAIITISEEAIPALTQLVQVEYIEKPTRLYYEKHRHCQSTDAVIHATSH